VSAANDAAFLRTFFIILGALVAFTIIILVSANLITGSVEGTRSEDPRLRAAIVERIAPVGRVNVAGAPASAAAGGAAAAPKSAADIVAGACSACHVAGVLGAPKLDDTDAWAQRLEAAGGVDALTSSVINGKGNMPARGGAKATDDELRAAVEHMLAKAGVQ
jgi:cytochrome c5